MRPRSHLLATARVPALLLAVSAPVAAIEGLGAQQTVPIRELSAARATSTVSFGNIFGVRQLVDGRTLVNDGVRRQLVILDQQLGGAQVIIDSVADGRQGYGPRAAPLIPYLGDSTLFVDGASLSLLVIDPLGRTARVMSAPKPADLRLLASSASGIDAEGRLIYRSRLIVSASTDGPPAVNRQPLVQPDSAPIIRADFRTRSVDTIGRVKISQPSRNSVTNDAAGRTLLTVTINPIQTIDEWAVLSDGTIAFVRGHDYHVEFLYPDGRTFSSPKLPFDWKRLTDAAKQSLVDSARADMTKRLAGVTGETGFGGAGSTPGGASVGSLSGAGSASAGGAGQTIIMRGGSSEANGGVGPTITTGGPMAPPKVEFVPLSAMADYYPPIRVGAARGDLDGRLWVLPTTSAQSKAGELVYDVIDNRGKLLQRVRLPVGRSLAGFGKGGIVFLMHRDDANGWRLERATIENDLRTSG